MTDKYREYFESMIQNNITDWLNIAKKRQETVKQLLEYFSAKEMYFDANQFNQIYTGLNLGFEFEGIVIYADTNFDYMQMKVIREGIQKPNVGIEGAKLYANPELDYKQMQSICHYLLAGGSIIKIKPYVDPKYDYMQLDIIGKALLIGIDRIDLIAKPTYGAAYMKTVAECILSYGAECVEKYLNKYSKKFFSSAQLKVVLDYADDWNKKFTERQKDFIANPNFNEKQMEEIADGFRCGLCFDEVKVYANPDFDEEKMRVIKGALRSKKVAIYDIETILNTDFNYEQIECIFKGMKKGYDVSIYAKECYSAEQMREILSALEENLSTEEIGVILNPKLWPNFMRLILNAFREGAKIREIISSKGELLSKAAIENVIKKYTDKRKEEQKKELAQLIF